MIADYPVPWPLVSLSRVANLIRGVSFSSSESYDTTHPNCLPILRSGNISDRLIINSDLVWVPESRVSDEQRLRKGDIAICMSSGSASVVGKTAALEENWIGSIGAFCAIIRPIDFIEPGYLAYYLKGTQFTQWRINQAQGANIQNIRGSELLMFPVPLPPLTEQQRIVEILQEAEEIRRLRAEAEAKTAELIPAIFYAIFGNPSEWKSGLKLGNIVDIMGGGTPSRSIEHYYSGSIPWATPKDIKKLYLDDTEEHITEEAIQSSATNLVPKGSVLVVVKSKILVHSVPVAITEVPMCFGQDIKGLIPLSGIPPEFMVYCLQAQLNRILSRTRGANTEGLNLEALKSLDIPKPSPELIEHFQLASNEIRKLNDISIVGNRLSLLTKDSLSAHAFSGQLTAEWREAHAEQLAREAYERDAALKEAGASLARPRSTLEQEIEELLRDRTEGIYAELNREQHRLFREIGRMVGGVSHIRYFTAHQLSNYITEGILRRNPHVIEGHLAVLAARGLVIPVSREEQTEDTGEYVYAQAFRLPLDDYEPFDGEDREPNPCDFSQTRELERLAEHLKKESSRP